MITYVTGNLFQSPAQVLVNTVNTVGVMGKGVALEFKKVYPDMFKQYQIICERNELDIGTLWLYKSPNKWVLNFPTKIHWRNSSKIEYIIAGLEKFAKSYSALDIHSIAFPPLGCGNGELDFKTQVQPIMEKFLLEIPIEVFIHPSRDDTFFIPEHDDIKAVRKWLRTEPTSLSFIEVWEDIKHALNNQNKFNTIDKKNPYTARITNNPEGIEIIASGRRRFVTIEDMMSLWQQLRTHGFTWRNITPGFSREMSYINPILASLPYIKPVKLADDYAKLNSSPVIGLQILPLASKLNKKVTQLALL